MGTTKASESERTEVRSGKKISDDVNASDENKEKCDQRAVSDFITNEKDENKVKGKSYDLKFYSSNVRGLRSKLESVKNLLLSESYDVALFSETQCSGNSNIKIPGYVNYFRNRESKSKGGVCVYIKERWAKWCMKLESGEGDNEFMFIKIEAFEPAIVICVYYGVIENRTPSAKVLHMQGDLFNTVKEYIDQGVSLQWAGDFNNHVGKALGLRLNSKEETSGGRNLVRFIEEEGLELVNNRHQAHTHIDVSKGSSKILDFLITNRSDDISDFQVDENYKVTPYRLKDVKGKLQRVFTDHLALTWKVRTREAVRDGYKIKTWNFGKSGGNARYVEETNRLGKEIENMILCKENIIEVYAHMMEGVAKAKDVAYGKSTKTKSQVKRESDKLLWRKRTREIEKAVKGLKKVKLTDKIWELRSATSEKYNDQQFVSIEDPETKKLTTSRDESYRVMLKYNTELLQKERDFLESESEDEEESEEATKARKLRQAKREVIRIAMDTPEPEEDSELEIEEFWKAIRKIKEKNKRVYRDLVMAGEEFQRAVFLFYNECYKQEITPDDFCETVLMKLFKNKGNRTQLKFNRFIHLKGWPAKTFEKMLMSKVESKMSEHTPSCQIGGQKLSSTNEHLVSLITLMRRLEQDQGYGATLFMDIRSCFDRVVLEDIIHETARAGVVGKPLRAISSYTNKLTIKLQGDCDPERSANIRNSTGQGSAFAPKGTSMVMACTLDNNFQRKSEEVKKKLIGEVKGLRMDPGFFVDDLEKTTGNCESLRLNGDLVTESLDELQLESHPDKSGVLVFGRKRDKMKEEIEKDPTFVQGHKMGFKTSEVYLGVVFHEGGASESITKTLEQKKFKCHSKTAELVKKVCDERLLSLGWLAVVKLLFNAIIVPTLTYGSAALTGMTKQQWSTLEAIQRTNLILLLGVSTKTNYKALLYTMGILPASDVLRKLQINFVNDLVHLKGNGSCLELLKSEEQIQDGKGLMSEVRQYCAHYGIGDVTKEFIHPETIKKAVIKKAMRELWEEVNLNVNIPWVKRKCDLSNPSFDTESKVYAKMALCYHTGAMNFKYNRKSEYMKAQGSLDCLVRGCGQIDSLSHVSRCYGYKIRPNLSGTHEQWYEYLLGLEEERVKSFGAKYSLLNFKKV